MDSHAGFDIEKKDSMPRAWAELSSESSVETKTQGSQLYLF